MCGPLGDPPCLHPILHHINRSVSPHMKKRTVGEEGKVGQKCVRTQTSAVHRFIKLAF